MVTKIWIGYNKYKGCGKKVKEFLLNFRLFSDEIFNDFMYRYLKKKGRKKTPPKKRKLIQKTEKNP